MEYQKSRTKDQTLRSIRLRNKKRKRRKFLFFVLLEIMILSSIFTYSYFLKKYTKIQRHDYELEAVKNNDISVENIRKMEGYWNIALFGVDSRNSSVGKGNNSDVIMIVSINKETGDIKLVSVYRDTFLDTGNGKYTKINYAYAVGGPEQAVKALNKNLDLNITDYITFNWKAVATVVNIMGGVDIEITKPEFKYINSYITETVESTNIGSKHLTKTGMQHLDGIQAVAYSRLRYMDTDYRRTERQREVLEQVFRKAKKADPLLLMKTMDLVLPMVATNLTVQDGIEMISRIGKYQIAETTGFPNDREDSDMGLKGWNIVAKTLESNVEKLHEFLFGTKDYKVSATVRNITATIKEKVEIAKEESIRESLEREKELKEIEDLDDFDFGDNFLKDKKDKKDAKDKKDKKNNQTLEDETLDNGNLEDELESLYNESLENKKESSESIEENEDDMFSPPSLDTERTNNLGDFLEEDEELNAPFSSKKNNVESSSSVDKKPGSSEEIITYPGQASLEKDKNKVGDKKDLKDKNKQGIQKSKKEETKPSPISGDKKTDNNLDPKKNKKKELEDKRNNKNNNADKPVKPSPNTSSKKENESPNSNIDSAVIVPNKPNSKKVEEVVEEGPR